MLSLVYVSLHKCFSWIWGILLQIFFPQARLFIYMQSMTFPENVLKVPNFEIFDRTDFHDF